MYGSAQFVPITEQHPLNAQSPYAATKIGADQLAISFHRSFGTPVSIIRPFNTYGQRQSLRAVIPAIAGQIMNGNGVVRLGSTTPIRDFTHVHDTAEGFVAALNSDEAVGEVINIGSNFEISISDTAFLIAKILNKKIKLMSDTERLRPTKSEVERLLADTQKPKKFCLGDLNMQVGLDLKLA